MPDRPALVARLRMPRVLRACALLAVAPLLGATLDAQTLRGSRDAVDRAYRTAQRRDLPFVRSRREVERRARAGDYVRLSSSRSVRLRGVSTPYVRPATRRFLTTFAARYQ